MDGLSEAERNAIVEAVNYALAKGVYTVDDLALAIRNLADISRQQDSGGDIMASVSKEAPNRNLINLVGNWRDVWERGTDEFVLGVRTTKAIEAGESIIVILEQASKEEVARRRAE